jgi:hypothetical protein
MSSPTTPTDDAFEASAWIAQDDELRARARRLAEKHGRDPDDLSKALRQLERSPSERLALGLRLGRLCRAARAKSGDDDPAVR